MHRELVLLKGGRLLVSQELKMISMADTALQILSAGAAGEQPLQQLAVASVTVSGNETEQDFVYPKCGADAMLCSSKDLPLS